MTKVALSEIQLDALGEVGNIGAGNASTSLAKMVGDVITLDAPHTRIMPFDQLPLATSAELEEVIISAYVAFTGQASGCLLLLFSHQQAATLFKLLGLPLEGNILEASELQKSAIGEVGNIITSAYLNALGTLTGLQLLPMPPGVALGMSGAILETVGAHLGQFAQVGIVIQIDIRSTNIDIGLELLMIPEFHSLKTLLTALGIDDTFELGTEVAGQ